MKKAALILSILVAAFSAWYFFHAETPVAFGAGGDNITYDTFTTGADANLDAHTPDTGTSWTQMRNNEGDDELVVVASTDVLTQVALDSSAGAGYYADSTYATSSYQVRYTCTNCAWNNGAGATDDYFWPIVRGTANPINSGYMAVDTVIGYSIADPSIRRITGTGTTVAVGDVFENGQAWSEGPIIDANDEIILQALNSEILFCEVTGKTCMAYAVDTNITATGQGGIGAGSSPYASGADFSAGLTIDDFKIIEVGNTTQGWNSPASTGETNNNWTNPTNAYSSNDTDTTASATSQFQDYGDFGFSTSDIGTLRGIMVKVEFEMSSADWGVLGMEVSNDNGATWSATGWNGFKDAGNPVVGDDEVVFGHANELWGLTWTASDLADTDFRVRLNFKEEQDTAAVPSVDHITVRIVYDLATGGGSDPTTGTPSAYIKGDAFISGEAFVD